MNKVKRVEVCKNITNNKKAMCYMVVIRKDNKHYVRTFGYDICGKKSALEKAIKWKRDKQRILGIERNQRLINTNYKSQNFVRIETGVSDITSRNRYRVRIVKDNTVHEKTFSYNESNKEEMLEKAKDYKQELICELEI